jgi:nascent polypeptide-associated complex subunit beta
MPGQFDPAKLQKFLASKAKAAADSRVGGKGTTRRKHKAVRKTATADDKRLKSTLSKLNVRDIPAIEEVNLFKDDGHVIHFAAPKVQASIAANTYVVSGNAETKKLQDLLPGIINQLGPDNLEDLKKIYASFKGEGGGLPNIPGLSGAAAADDNDDDMPELVENFEEVAAKAAPAKAAPAKAAEPVKAEAPKADKKQSKKEEAPKAAEPVVAKKEEVKPAAAAAKKEETPASPKVEAKKAPKAAETPKEAAPKKAEAAKTPAAAAPAKTETPKPAAKAEAAPKKAETPKTDAKKEAKKEQPKASPKGGKGK